MTANLVQQYKSLVNLNKLSFDDAQLDIVIQLDTLKCQIEFIKYTRFYNLKSYLLNIFSSKSKEKYKQGFYLYSDVGRGKTLLMDLFINNLDVDSKQKMRQHFHVFMKSIHEQLQQVSGFKNPLEYIVKANFKKYRIICLDEFLVHDIADAMLLSNLLKYLFKFNINVITTSNTRPDNLYKNGLQRKLFLPAIDLINDNLNVIELKGQVDYRAKMFKDTGRYFYPCTDENINKINSIFIKLSTSNRQPCNHGKTTNIEINHRNIDIINVADGCCWFDYNVICSSPRNQYDYIEIAEIYKIVLLSNLPVLTDKVLDKARRFISLIDILYDYKVKLIICSDVAISEIYIGKGLEFEFTRTISRLKEMQSSDYLSAEHL